jgi:hypothetical protein
VPIETIGHDDDMLIVSRRRRSKNRNCLNDAIALLRRNLIKAQLTSASRHARNFNYARLHPTELVLPPDKKVSFQVSTFMALTLHLFLTTPV